MPITPMNSSAVEYAAMFYVGGVEFRVTAVHPMDPDEQITDAAAQKVIDLLDSSPDVTLGLTTKTRSETLSVTPS